MVQLQNPSDQSIMLIFDENWEIWLEKFPNIKGIPTKEWGLSENFLSVYPIKLFGRDVRIEFFNKE